MGGMVSCVVRDKNSQVKAFKVHTSDLYTQLNDPKIFNPSFLDSLMKKNNWGTSFNRASTAEHENYDFPYAFQVPYHYGILLIDYVHNQIFNCQDYSPLLAGSSARLLNEYMDLRDGDFQLEFHQKKNIQVLDLLHERFNDYFEVYFMNHAIENKLSFSLNEQSFTPNSLEDAIEKIYGLNFKGKNKKQIDELYYQYKKEKRPIKISDYTNIIYQYPFAVYNGDSSDAVKAFNYMKDHGFIFSQEETAYWNDFIQKHPSE